MANRPNVNRKHRAKIGGIKHRLEYGTFYPCRMNHKKLTLRQATAERVRLELEHEYEIRRDRNKRFEEDDARIMFMKIPGVHEIAYKISKGKWHTAQ